MTLYALKPAFQSWLRPMVARLAAAGVTANEVTVTAMVGSCLVGAVALVTESRAAFLAIPTWLVLRMALNAIDGMLAREHGQRSRLGACLNEIGDVVSDAALYAPFAALPALGTGPVALVIGLALLSEFAGVLGPMIGASRRYDGPLGKSDRALLAGAFAAWIGFGGAVASWAAVGLWLVVPLLGFTAVNRVRGALSETRFDSRRAVPPMTAVAPPATFTRPVHEGTFTTHDGVALFYRHWPAVSAVTEGAVLLFHRGHEHSGRVAHLPDEFDLPGHAFFAWDARGHGRSPGRRGFSPGVDASVRDVQTFVDHIAAQHGIASRTSPSWPRASAPCSRRPGRTTTPRRSARWCSPRRPSR